MVPEAPAIAVRTGFAQKVRYHLLQRPCENSEDTTCFCGVESQLFANNPTQSADSALLKQVVSSALVSVNLWIVLSFSERKQGDPQNHTKCITKLSITEIDF